MTHGDQYDAFNVPNGESCGVGEPLFAASDWQNLRDTTMASTELVVPTRFAEKERKQKQK
jgi:hypothetical protein